MNITATVVLHQLQKQQHLHLDETAAQLLYDKIHTDPPLYTHSVHSTLLRPHLLPHSYHPLPLSQSHRGCVCSCIRKESVVCLLCYEIGDRQILVCMHPYSHYFPLLLPQSCFSYKADSCSCVRCSLDL